MQLRKVLNYLYGIRYSKTCLKRPLSKGQHFEVQDQLLLNAGQKYCRMLQGEHSVILSTIKLPFAIKIFVLSILGWSCLDWFYCKYFRNIHSFL